MEEKQSLADMFLPMKIKEVEEGMQQGSLLPTKILLSNYAD